MKLDDIPTCELVDEIVRRGYEKRMIPAYGIAECVIRDVNRKEIAFDRHNGPMVLLAIDD